MSRLIVILLIMSFFNIAKAQSGIFVNGFEQRDPFGLWTNVNARYDTTAYRGNHVNHIDATQEYGLGLVIRPVGELAHQNINISYEAAYRYTDSEPNGTVVVSIGNKSKNLYWTNYPTTGGTMGEWFKSGFTTTIPADYIPADAVIKIYVWNNKKSVIDIDEAKIEIKAEPMPRFLPEHQNVEIAGRGNKIVGNQHYGVVYHYVNKTLSLTNTDNVSVTKGIYTVTEAIIATDTMTFFGHQWLPKGDSMFVCTTPIGSTEINFHQGKDGQLKINTQSHYNLEMKIVRQALAIPFVDGVTEVYRNNGLTDTAIFQDCYYLTDNGFSIGKGKNRVSAYHNSKISSLQLDAKNHTAYFNADYWRDHPLLHYPLDNDTIDYFVDVSCREVNEQSVMASTIELNIGTDANRIPVFMPTSDGFDAAIIFTEHADWTDIRTQRAVLFGNENITQADSAVGGFVYYNVPVTKSVFYNNPDSITNEERSGGAFTSEQASLMGNTELLNTIGQINEKGFDICLHTPEQYTTQDNNMDEALAFMHEHFNSVSWIDHGYNNTLKHNREDLVCDGLLPESPWYSLPLWRKHGIRYLWNAYYEENPLPQYDFDCNLMHPYPGFGDALPRPQVTTLPDGDTTVILWSTPSTYETDSDGGWNYFFSRERLERIADNHDVFITHIYPAWVLQERSFWEYGTDSLITARKGFNEALSRISDLRSEKRLNTTTIAKQLSYIEGIRKIKYDITNNNHIILTNTGNSIKGVTMLFSEMPDFGTKEIKTRQSSDGIVVWFDMDKNESLTIKYRE